MKKREKEKKEKKRNLKKISITIFSKNVPEFTSGDP